MFAQKLHPAYFLYSIQVSFHVAIFFNWDSLWQLWDSLGNLGFTLATARHGVIRKRSTKRLKHTENLFRKNLQLMGVC